MRTRSNHTLRSNFIALSIVQGTNFLLPLLVMPYVISRVGAAGFGVIAVAQSAMIWLSAVADYGFNLSATRDTAMNSENTQKISAIFFTVLATRLLICSFLLILLCMTFAFIPALTPYFTMYFLGFTYVIGQSLLAGWFFQGKEKMHYITISTFIARLVFVGLVFLFIHQEKDGVYFLFFLGAGNIIAGLFSIFIAVRIFQLQLIWPSWPGIVHELKEGWQITVSNLSIYTYLYSGIFILRIFTSDTIVGYYSIAERIFFAARQVLSVFSQVVYPRICQLSLLQKEKATGFFKTVYLPFLFMITGGCGLLFILSPQIIHLFLHETPQIAVLLLRMLSFVPVIVCLNIPAYNLLLAFDRKKSYLLVLVLATILNISANILLVRLLGAAGTALSIIITELFITTALNQQLYKNKLYGYILPGT